MQRRNERFVERLPLATVRPIFAYLAAGLLSVIALAIRLSVDGVLPNGFPFVTFFPAVIIASFLFGVGPGIFAAVLCGLFSWFFYIGPTHAEGAGVAILFYIGVVATDIALVHWMQRANYKLAVERERNRTLAENRELLFRELQHRVSNNLQVVASLVSLQRRGVKDAAARKALDEASGRIGMIGRISRNLYDPDGQRTGLRPFLQTMVGDLLEASGRKDISVALDVRDGLTVHSDLFVPLSLVVAETVSNAMEHGFDGQGGRIVVTLAESEPNGMLLEVADDGRGLPADFAVENADSLGLRIATTLASQLGGRFELLPGEDRGARALLSFPV